MTEVYIVEELGWDHHENIRVFLNKEDAVNFCNTEYGESKDGLVWKGYSYNYYIIEYDVN